MSVEMKMICNILLDTLNIEPNVPERYRLQSLSPDEWQAALKVARQQHVTPLLYTRLRDKGLQTAVPIPIWQQLHHHHQINTMHNLNLYGELSKIASALQGDDIPFILLKGAFLADAAYDSMGERVIGDLDLLVPKDTMPQVMAISEKLGYQKTKSVVVLDVVLTQRHHVPPLINQITGLLIEWHWHIVLPTAYNAIPVEELWQRAIPATVANIPVLTLSPEDLLLHLADHVSYHHEFTFGMRSLCDLSVICKVYGSVIDWDMVVERTKQWRWQRGVYLALRLAIERFGATVPPFVLDRLCPDDFAEGLMETAVSQIFTDPAEFKFVPATFRTIQGSQGFVKKARLIWNTLFPSPERMGMRYGIAPGSMSWLKLHLFRWQDLLQRAIRYLRRQAQREESILPAVKRRNELSAWMSMPSKSQKREFNP